jgi:hypothetical protein
MRTTVSKTLIFGSNGNAPAFQADGWRGPEDGYDWTTGVESTLVIDWPRTPHGQFIEMRVNADIPGAGLLSNKVELFIGEKLVAWTAIDHLGTFAPFVAPGATAGGYVVLRIRHPETMRLAFHRIRVLSLDQPADSADSMQARPGWNRAVSVGNSEQIALEDLVINFEMLAGDCEFGNMQRHLGFEPLSLLRFAGATPGVAIDGLDRDFEGVGEDIEPYTVEGHGPEWMIRDNRYGMNYHSRISSDDVPREEIIRMEQRKIRFLRQKFLEDLEASDKIFVCSTHNINSIDEIMALFLALRRKTNRALLWVRSARDTGETPGTVTIVMPGLMIGHIESFSPPEDLGFIYVDAWLAVLTNALIVATRWDMASTP